jgi:hypothetical protein
VHCNFDPISYKQELLDIISRIAMYKEGLGLRGGKVTNHLTGGNTVNTIRALPCRIRTALAPKGRRIALCVRAKTIIKTHIGRVTAHYMRATAHGECLIDVACRVE